MMTTKTERRPACVCGTAMLRSVSGWVCPKCPAKIRPAVAPGRIEIGTPSPDEKCDECDGTGKIECYVCDGTGYDECPHCEQEMACEECDGSGWLYCECDAGDELRVEKAESKG